MYKELAFFAIFVFIYSVVAGRVERAAASGPIVFILAGLIMGPLGLGWFDGDPSSTWLRVIADLTLAVLLFVDAARADLRTLRKHLNIPVRMLVFGLPGTIALGTIVALVLFETLSVYQAAILGTILAATDAALGKPVISNPLVPARIREGLNVESGLNDGLCVPFLLLFVTLSLGEQEGSTTVTAVTLVVEELGVGIVVGLAFAGAGYLLLRECRNRGWVTDVWMQITSVALAVSCFAVAQSVHASGYIAAFTGGVLFGYLSKETHELVHPAEGIGETLALMTWFAFGTTVVGQAFARFTWEMLAYSALSLTVIRMLPIYLSLTGTGEPPYTRLFLGWFGPRGLASFVFALIVVNEGVPGASFIGMVVVLTVSLSVVLHGITANPLAKRLGADRQPSAE